MTLGKLFYLFVPLVPHLKYGDKYIGFFVRSKWRISCKFIELFLVSSNCAINVTTVIITIIIAITISLILLDIVVNLKAVAQSYRCLSYITSQRMSQGQQA